MLGDLDPQMVPVEELEKEKVTNEKGETRTIPKLGRPVDKWVWH